MIWNSVPLMTVIDLLILWAALYSVAIFIKYYRPTKQLGLANSVNLILFGLVLIALFYLLDLFTMHLLPGLTNPGFATNTMMNLHLNWSWLGILISVGAIAAGLSYLIQVLIPQTQAAFADIERTQQNLRGELAAHQQTEQVLRESHESLEQRVAERTAELEALRQIGLELTATLDLPTLLQSIMMRAADLLEGEQGGFFLYRPQLRVLELVANYQINTPVGTQLQVGQGLAGKVWEVGQPFIIERYRDWEGHLPFLADEIGERSIIGITVQQGEAPVGVLTITGRDGRVYDESDLALLNLFAASAAVAIQNAHLYNAQQQAETEREVLIADLEAKNAELERFTYTVSHDLKSPLVTVKGFLGLLQNDIAQGQLDRAQEDIGWIQEAAVKMGLMLDELLELSRIGRLVNEPQAVLFNELAEEAVKLVSGRIAERGVQVEIAPELPTVVVDRARLVEVLQNLVDNAVKFMGNQSHPLIIIGARQNGTETVLFVQDNGMGIDPQYHDQVFTLFHRLDTSVEGTGIGLALAQRIVEVHGGRLWVESAVGKGATFCFTLG